MSLLGPQSRRIRGLVSGGKPSANCDEINPSLGCDPALPKWDDHKILQIWVFPNIGVTVSQNGWFIMENPMKKWDDLGGFHPPIFGNTHMCVRRTYYTSGPDFLFELDELDEHSAATIWVFPKIVVPPSGWFLMENLIKVDDLGVPLFLETPK